MHSTIYPPVARRLNFLALALFTLLIGSNVSAQSDNGLTPLQVSRIDIVTGTNISPDGRYIVFTKAVPADPFKANNFATNQLFVLDRETGTTISLHTASSVAGVAFRPETGTITFLGATAPKEVRGLYEVPVTGGTPTKILNFARPIISYSWSPDGTRVAFSAMDEAPKPVTPIAYTPDFYEENMPQRSGYVASIGSDEAPRKIPAEGSYYQFVWSPNGDRIAVSVAPTSSVDDSYMFQAIRVIDANSLDIVATIENEGKLGDIVWSPNGERIAIRAGHNINDPIDGNILVVSASGGKPQDIFENFEGKFEKIDWVSDNEIYFVASEGVNSVFGRINPDGSGFEKLASKDGLAFTTFDRTADGKVVFPAHATTHPHEVVFLDANSTDFQRLTNSNAWLDGIELGEQRVVRYTARDKEFEIEGILILPLGYKEGTRVPVIVNVHGGPEAHYLNGWLTNYSTPGQVGAANGFAVFYPNYRGSTGRGLKFSMSSQSDAGGKEFDDIVDGVDYLISTGIADENKIGVTGGSYGGYATAWMSTRYSARFAAGVMFVGISNDISKWGTSDIPHELNLVHSRENMWENKWMKYLERSAIYHVDSARTPLLIMHGAQDTRVHPAQSLELYRHIKVRKPEVPLRLIFYPGEGHGNGRAGSRLDYNFRMIEWFNTYLKGPKDSPLPSVDIATPTR